MYQPIHGDLNALFNNSYPNHESLTFVFTGFRIDDTAIHPNIYKSVKFGWTINANNFRLQHIELNTVIKSFIKCRRVNAKL